MRPYNTKADGLVAANWTWILRVAEELDRLIGLRADEILDLKPAV
jgi:hypothetical protein